MIFDCIPDRRFQSPGRLLGDWPRFSCEAEIGILEFLTSFAFEVVLSFDWLRLLCMGKGGGGISSLDLDRGRRLDWVVRSRNVCEESRGDSADVSVRVSGRTIEGEDRDGPAACW